MSQSSSARSTSSRSSQDDDDIADPANVTESPPSKQNESGEGASFTPVSPGEDPLRAAASNQSDTSSQSATSSSGISTPLSARPNIPGIKPVPKAQPINETVNNLVTQIAQEISEIKQITNATSDDSDNMYKRSKYIQEVIYQLTFKVKYLFAIYKVLIKTVIDLREQLEKALEKPSTSDASVGDDEVDDDIDDDSDTRSSIGTSSLTESESPTEIVKKLTELRTQIVNIKAVLKKIQSQVKATAANLPDDSNTQSLLNSLKEMNKYLTLSPEQDIQAGEIDRAAQLFENKNIEDLKKLNTSDYSFNPNLTKPQKPIDDPSDPNLEGVEGTARSIDADGKPNNSPFNLLGNLIPDQFKGNGGKRKRKSRKRFRKTKGGKKINTKKRVKKYRKRFTKKGGKKRRVTRKYKR